jgi:outer membrane PBP1 activator LpoA protein
MRGRARNDLSTVHAHVISATMNINLSALVLSTALLASSAAFAQGAAPAEGTMQSLAAEARADKRAYVNGALRLTEEEGKRFWPIYDAYQRSIAANTRRLTRMVEDVVAVGDRTSDAYAKNLAAQYLIAHDDEARDFRRLHKSTMRALPAHKAVRYIQIENKLRAIRDYEHASAMPLLK